jgi:hypothetical protein
MRFVVRVVGLIWTGIMLVSLVGAIAARAAKSRSASVEAPDADEVAITAFLEPLNFRSTATKFRGGTVDCWYGGGAIDLRDAVLDPAGALLKVRAVFGGSQILVPETWRVSSRVVGIGGLGDARPRVEYAADAPHLTIEGVAVFGGFGIASEMSEAQARGLREAVARSSRREHKIPVAATT